ncbi:hypothetical protein C2E20_3679 [Micractinium conductrix]|uniref:Uncharacterized protein n=1 Tax=Micractinium conductrix TaxID=554055 RepID=A0A2P6VGF1_9CHLO|nr:hypothetical protein C2E20_3679 [Micractinium conductrix]|eukprot:PSC73169.1 hypothetical protein C2E20_3679 [Micractinium conductrix]
MRQLQQQRRWRCRSSCALALACLLVLAPGASAQAGGWFDLIPGTGSGATPDTPPVTTTPVPSPVAAPPAPVVATPVPSPVAATPTPAVGTPVAEPPSFGSLTPSPGAPAAVPGSSNVTVGTPAVAAPPGSDAVPVDSVGTVAAPVPSPPADVLPPAPPEAWQALQKDCQIVFQMEIRGPYIVPFTSPKATVIARVLHDRYLRSTQTPDIAVAAIATFTYMSSDSPTINVDGVPTGEGTRRRLASRDLLQLEKSGAELKIIVATNQVRVPSEIGSVEDGVTSGSLAADLSMAGVEIENITFIIAPYTEDLIGPGNTEGNNGHSTMDSWVIGVIVGVILLALPVPLFFLFRWRRRRSKEAAAVAEAEAEAARQRMQSRMMRPGSKSFSLKPGGSSADIMVMSGSMGGLAGYNHNGRLQSWSGSPERMYGQQYQSPLYSNGGMSRAGSVTSLGSVMPSARSYSMPQRVSSLPGVGRSPFQGQMAPPAGAYEEELHTARSARSQAPQ